LGFSARRSSVVGDDENNPSPFRGGGFARDAPASRDLITANPGTLFAISGSNNAMRKPSLIVAVSAIYCLIHVLLLLGTMARPDWIPENSTFDIYRRTVYCAELLILPGMAVLFSLVSYGCKGWMRRALAIFLFTFIVIPACLFAAAFLIGVVFPFSISIGVLLVVLSIYIVVRVSLVVRKTSHWAVEREAARWLEERRTSPSPALKRRRLRAVQVASTMAVGLVLPAYLFFFQIWGVTSQLGRFQPGELVGYSIEIPRSWIMLHTGRAGNGRSWVGGLFYGDTFVLNPRVTSLSDWMVNTESAEELNEDSRRLRRWIPPDKFMVHQEEITIGDETLACKEYRLRPYYGGLPDTEIFCTGSKALAASFVGWQSQTSKFYAFLRKIRHVKNQPFLQ
jgi:hypothetical protein